MKNALPILTSRILYPVLIVVLLPLLGAGQLLAQTNVRGTVVDDEGTALVGVTVLELGTQNGTITDEDGTYNLSVNPEASLVFSYVGFSTQQIVVGDKNVIDVTLQPDYQQLDDIVVTGYGTQQRKEITSSVVSLEAKDFNKGNVSDPVQLLQGKVAGLQIARAGGNPNQPFTLRLRGLNTLSGDSEPLIVIDGVLGGALDALDPNDITSIEVLKDASAAAIYGARASAGVLIITTKSGEGVSRPQLNYNGQVSFEEIANHPDIASAEEYLSLGGVDLGSKTDWLDEVTQTGISHVHNISFANNAGGLNYRAAVNYRNVESIVKNAAEFDQLNTRLDISQRLLNDKLTLSGALAATSREENQGFQHALSHAFFFNPTAPVFDADGNYFETGDQDRYNPVAINDQNVRDRKLNRQISNIKAEYEVISNLLISASYTLQRSSELIGEYSARDALWGGGLVNGWARRETIDNSYQQYDGTITYLGEAGDLGYTVIAGQSWNYENIQQAVASNTDFITDEFSYNNLAAGQGINKNGVVSAEGNVAQPQNFLGSNQQESRSNAYFLRTNFNYDDAYFLSASYRREGSSRFGSNNRWGDFWAVSGGADIAKIMSLPISQLKVRAGYGVTGTLPNVFYGYLATLQLTSGGFANGGFISGVTPATGSNPDLKWEEKAELNLGLDFGLMNSRLSGSLEYFIRNTKDLLNIVAVPSPPNAVTQQLRNVGELESKGIEFQLSYVAIQNQNFNWSIDANISTAKTKLIEFNSESDQTVLRGPGPDGAVALGGVSAIWTSEGEEIGQIYAQPFVRYNENGDPILLLLDGTEAPYGSFDFREEARNVADALPNFVGGLNNNVRYKDFDINVFLRGVFGHSLVNGTRAAFENVGGISIRNVLVTEGVENIPVAHYSTRYIENASFVKIDNVTIGYTIPGSDNSLFRSIRLFATGQNLITITGYEGADPEVRYFDPPYSGEGRRINSFTGNGLFPGIDRYTTFPPTRIYTVGVNLGF